MFVFRNPGLMRIPIEQALIGGDSDCRNRKLHQMFRLINIGEQAGSGIPKILSGWKSQHWLPPYLHEKREPNNQTIVELKMLDLFPEETMQQLTAQFGSIFTELSQDERAALAIGKLEGLVTHERLQTISGIHSADISRNLQHLVRAGFLSSNGGGRGAVYTLAGASVVRPDDIFGPQSDLTDDTESAGINDSTSSGHNGPSSGHNEPGSGHNGPNFGANAISGVELTLNRDTFGRLCSDKLHFPVIDDLSLLPDEFKAQLYFKANAARTKQRLAPEVMTSIILQLCHEQFLTISTLALLLKRKPDALRKHYLSPMVKNKSLCLAFPTRPTHEKQAYRTNTDIKK